MFNNSMNIDNKSILELINTDIKVFQNGDDTFKVSQITVMDSEKLLKRKDELIKSLNDVRDSTKSNFVILMVTDILKNGCFLFNSDDTVSLNTLSRALGDDVYEGLFLDGVVSRKKQIIPLIMEA